MSANPHATAVQEAIPQLDLAAQYAAIGGEVREAIDRVLASQHFVLGREGSSLEQEIARLCQVQHGIALASGTDALILALRACGVQAGDEVILPPFTFVATGSAVSALGAKPVFADIHPSTYNIDPAELERRVTSRTRAIVVVHLYGLAANMDPIVGFAKGRNLPVIEDNAQAIGAAYNGRPTGSLADVACLSFYPTKNLGAYGDAGMVVTNSAELAARIRTLRNHGQTEKYVSSEPGWNPAGRITGRDSACEVAPFARLATRAAISCGRIHSAPFAGSRSNAADRARWIRPCLPPVHHSRGKARRITSRP